MMMNRSVQNGCKPAVVSMEKRPAELTKRFVEGRLGRRRPRCMTVDDSYRAPSYLAGAAEPYPSTGIYVDYAWHSQRLIGQMMACLERIHAIRAETRATGSNITDCQQILMRGTTLL